MNQAIENMKKFRACPVSINDSSVERESSELEAKEAWGSPDELLSCPICPKYFFENLKVKILLLANLSKMVT